MSNAGGSHGPLDDPANHLQRIVEHAAYLLPAQGPIGVFIHHNTLHAFQHLPFEEAVLAASQVYGTEPYLSEEAYRREVGRGRMQMEDIDAVLAEEPDSLVWNAAPSSAREPRPALHRHEFRRRLLVPGLRRHTADMVMWELEEGALQEAMEGDGARRLFQLCWELTPLVPAPHAAPPARPRDGFLRSRGVDLDELVHPWLIRFLGAYLDQGISYWPMPNRDQGLFEAARALIALPGCLRPNELHTLAPRMLAAGKTPEAVVQAVFAEFGIAEAEWESVVQAELLALAGWAGMISRLELEPGLAPHEWLPARLMDFLALRLLFAASAADSLGCSLKSWRDVPAEVVDPAAAEKERLAQAATFFEAVGSLGLSEADLRTAGAGAIAHLRQELLAFDEIERRRLFHLAYERRHERQILLPLAEHCRRGLMPAIDRPTAQVLFCMDDREESIRRHLEEVAPEMETLGAAGFFGVAIDYTGIDDAQGVSLCPVVVKPGHAVTEQPLQGQNAAFETRLKLRRLWASVSRQWWVSSRTMFRGWLGTSVLGIFSIVPLTRILNPHLYARLARWLNDSVLPEPRTELAFVRQDVQGHTAAESLLAGFAVSEKVERVASVLGPAGLYKRMARVVVVLGHGSTSLNNPHESAYNCGACGGRHGGPNGRLFAAMANRPGVREGLRAKGIFIPADTWFVGGYHDTCNDTVDLYDLDAVPETHREDLARVRVALDKARARSAHERTRRFEAAAPGIDFAGGLHHVQERAEHLAEPRPEYGHSTNAVCIVGRRRTTRGLFLDRRAFLTSYDATQDADDSSLALLLSAVVPVCAGISLEYFFSTVDNERYGCGTKLPHNIAGLVGVMNGHESDLRTGLTWQMVEIHEPVRILFVVETAPARVLETMRRNPLLWEFLNNRWIRLAAQDPETGEVQMYRQGPGRAYWEPVTALESDAEILPVAPSSTAWYRGKTEHLPIARIENASMASATMAGLSR